MTECEHPRLLGPDQDGGTGADSGSQASGVTLRMAGTARTQVERQSLIDAVQSAAYKKRCLERGNATRGWRMEKGGEDNGDLVIAILSLSLSLSLSLIAIMAASIQTTAVNRHRMRRRALTSDHPGGTSIIIQGPRG